MNQSDDGLYYQISTPTVNSTADPLLACPLIEKAKALYIQIRWFLMKPSVQYQPYFPHRLKYMLKTGIIQVNQIKLERGIVHKHIRHDKG